MIRFGIKTKVIIIKYNQDIRCRIFKFPPINKKFKIHKLINKGINNNLDNK